MKIIDNPSSSKPAVDSKPTLGDDAEADTASTLQSDVNAGAEGERGPAFSERDVNPESPAGPERSDSMKAHPTHFVLWLVGVYRWYAERLARVIQIRSAVKLEDWEDEDNDPAKVKWRKAALLGAAREACTAALVLDAQLQRLLLDDSLSACDRGGCEDERDRVREATRDLWPIVNRTPPWEEPAARTEEEPS